MFIYIIRNPLRETNVGTKPGENTRSVRTQYLRPKFVPKAHPFFPKLPRGFIFFGFPFMNPLQGEFHFLKPPLGRVPNVKASQGSHSNVELHLVLGYTIYRRLSIFIGGFHLCTLAIIYRCKFTNIRSFVSRKVRIYFNATNATRRGGL